MLDDTLGEEVLLDAGACRHEYGADGGIASAVNGGEAVGMVGSVALSDVVDNIARVRTALA